MSLCWRCEDCHTQRSHRSAKQQNAPAGEGQGVEVFLTARCDERRARAPSIDLVTAVELRAALPLGGTGVGAGRRVDATGATGATGGGGALAAIFAAGFIHNVAHYFANIRPEFPFAALRSSIIA